MIALGLLVLSTTTLLASACTDWKSMDLKRPDIPSLDNVDVLIEENQSVDIQVIQAPNHDLRGGEKQL